MISIHKPPASIRFAPIKHALAVTVEPFKFSSRQVGVAFFGTHRHCRGRHRQPDLPRTGRLPQNQAARVGEELTLSVAPEDVVLPTR